MPRPSPVRDALAEVLRRGDAHCPSLDELAELLARRGGQGKLSSIFRAAAYLEREGVVRRVELADRKLRYEVAGIHHDHVRCDSCGAVEPVPPVRGREP